MKQPLTRESGWEIFWNGCRWAFSARTIWANCPQPLQLTSRLWKCLPWIWSTLLWMATSPLSSWYCSLHFIVLWREELLWLVSFCLPCSSICWRHAATKTRLFIKRHRTIWWKVLSSICEGCRWWKPLSRKAYLLPVSAKHTTTARKSTSKLKWNICPSTACTCFLWKLPPLPL